MPERGTQKTRGKMSTKAKNKNLIFAIASAIYAIIFTFTLVVGGVVYDRDLLPTWSLIKQSGKLVYASPVIAFIVFAAVFFLLKLLSKKETPKAEFLPKAFHHFYIPAIFIFAFYSFVFLSYFPGTWCYDISQQNRMIIGTEAFTKHHPPLHTFIWGACLSVEKITNGKILGITVYSVLQIILTSLVYGKMVSAIQKITKNDIFEILAFLFLLLNPTFALFSFCPTKDAWFQITFLLGITILSERFFLKEEKKISRNILFAVCMVLSCLFRNNMIYALFLCGIIVLICFRKHWKEIAITLAITIVSFYAIDAGLFGIMGIKSGSKLEMMSVPIEQVARVCRDYYDDVKDDEKAVLDELIGAENMHLYYNPRSTDAIKPLFDKEAFDANTVEFLKVWAKLGLRHPVSYIEAYVSLYSPYWYIRSKDFDTYINLQYIEDGINVYDGEVYRFELKGYLPKVHEFYHKVAYGDNKIPSRGWPLLGSITALFFAVLLKKKSGNIIPLLCLCYMGTLFLGPYGVVRYEYPILAAFPLLIVSIMQSNESQAAID